MPLDPRRTPSVGPGIARRLAAVASLLAAAGCAGAELPPALCALTGGCGGEEAVELPPPPTVAWEPAPVVAPPIEGGRLLLRSVTFAAGSAEIDAEAALVLDVAAGEILERAGVRVRVEGHTDAVGDDDANQALALRRAEAVRRYLVRKGVAPQRLETLARGASRPVASNATEEGRAHNRRVELVVI